jgi:hypothetical protein
METYSFLTFMGGILVGMGMGMLLLALVVVIIDWKSHGDT